MWITQNFLKISFSGTSKRRRKEETTGKNVKKAQHELDHNGLVPLPVKVCFTCNRYLFFQEAVECSCILHRSKVLAEKSRLPVSFSILFHYLLAIL